LRHLKRKPGAEAAANDLTAKTEKAETQEPFEMHLKNLLKSVSGNIVIGDPNTVVGGAQGGAETDKSGNSRTAA